MRQSMWFVLRHDGYDAPQRTLVCQDTPRCVVMNRYESHHAAINAFVRFGGVFAYHP